MVPCDRCAAVSILHLYPVLMFPSFNLRISIGYFFAVALHVQELHCCVIRYPLY
jgi:hypothetical protein